MSVIRPVHEYRVLLDGRYQLTIEAERDKVREALAKVRPTLAHAAGVEFVKQELVVDTFERGRK